MVVYLKMLYGILLLLMSIIGCVSSMDAVVYNCGLLTGEVNSLDNFANCMQEKELRGFGIFRLDISQASPEQIDDLFGKVEKIFNIVIIAKSSSMKKISFPSLTLAEDLQFEVWNNHELKSIEFPVLDRNLSTFGRTNIVGNELLNQATLDFFNNAPKDSEAKTDQIQDFGECYHGDTGLSEESDAAVKLVDSSNWKSFSNCRYHSGDLNFSSSLLDFHTAQFGNMFKNVSGCVIVQKTHLSNVNFLGVSNGFCDDYTAEAGIHDNERLCLTEEQDNDFGSRQTRNRDSTCRHHCYQAENGTLIPMRGSSKPCQVIEGSMYVGPDTPETNIYSSIKHVEGSVRFVGTKLTSIQLTKLQTIGNGCEHSLEIRGNADLQQLSLQSFVSNGIFWNFAQPEKCKNKIVIRNNEYKIPDTDKTNWEKAFPNAHLDIEYKDTNVDNSWKINWWYVLAFFSGVIFMVVVKLARDYYLNCRTLNVVQVPKFLVEWSNGVGSIRSKEQLVFWVKTIIMDTFFGYRSASYLLQKHYHCSRQSLVKCMNQLDAARTNQQFDDLTVKFKKLLKRLPPISVLPNPLNAPSTMEGEFGERFEMYKRMATQEENTIVIMYDDNFVREESKKPLSRIPFRLKDESRNSLPKEMKQVVKDADGNPIMHPRDRIPLKESISFKYMGVQPTNDYKKCRKVEIYVQTKIYNHETNKIEYNNRRMFVIHWATYGYDSLPTSQKDIAHLLTLRKKLWNNSMRLWVFSGLALEFHLNFQMLLWTILSAPDSMCPEMIDLQTVVDLSVAISSGNDGGFNLNMLCYTMHSMVAMASNNNLIAKSDPKYSELEDWLVIANKADPVMRFLVTGSLYLEDVNLPVDVRARLELHPKFSDVLTFAAHTEIRGGIPALRWPVNFWIAYGRFPLTVLPVTKFPRVEFLDHNRDYSVKWEPLAKRLKKSRRLTMEEVDLIYAWCHRPEDRKRPGALEIKDIPQINPVDVDVALINHNKEAEEKKALDKKRAVYLESRAGESESFAVTLSPASDSLSIAPDVVAAGGIFRILINDPEGLKQSQKEYKIQSLGLISGKQDEASLIFTFIDDSEGIDFEKGSYDLQLEHSLREDEIAVVKLTSPSYGTSFQLTGPEAAHFRVSSEGDQVFIKTIKCEDCLVPNRFTLLLTAENKKEPKYALLNFVNKGGPGLRFDEPSYSAEIQEESSVFRKLVKLKATGAKDVTYSLEDTSGLFSIHPKNGLLTVQHPEFLTQDTVGEELNLTAKATSGVFVAKTNVTIRILANIEQDGIGFSQDDYHFIAAAATRFVGRVKLQNSECLPEYRFSEDVDVSDFTAENGSIMFVGVEFPKEDQDYELILLGICNSLVASTKVSIKMMGIGSNSIKIEGNGFRTARMVAEAQPGTVLSSLLVMDSDDDAVLETRFSGLKGRDLNGATVELSPEYLQLKNENKKVDVVLKKSIGDLEISTIELDVFVKDSAHPKEPEVQEHIEIFVIRMSPMIKDALPLKLVEVSPITLSNTVPVGSFVYQMRSIPMDKNGEDRFHMEIPSPQYAVEAATGRLLTITPLVAGSAENITVVVVRGLETAKTTITIGVLPEETNGIEFTQREYMATVTRDAQVDTVILTMPLKEPTEGVQYSIIGSDLVTLNEKNELRLSSPIPSGIQQIFAVIETTKNDKKITAEVKINIEKSVAKEIDFDQSEYEITVMENAPINSFVTDVKINSLEDVKYKIKADEGEQFLDIDDDGRITVRNELNGITKHSATVTATVGPVSNTTTVTLKVLPSFSCIPEFIEGQNDVFYIDENSKEGSVIGRISAKELDPKCDLKFHLWDNDYKKIIQETAIVSVNPENGEIKARKMFDFEKTQSYQLLVGLSSGQRHFVIHSSDLIIKDVDDHPIKFNMKQVNVEVSESSALNSTVTQMMAVDRDATQKVYYRMKESVEEFQLNGETGEITVASPLDREKKDYFELEIGASNSPDAKLSEIHVWAMVVVTVRDVNDNGPIFERGRYEVLLHRKSLPGFEIIKLTATDPDQNNNDEDSQSVFYSIDDCVFEYRGMRKPLQGIFKIDRNNGVVTLGNSVSDFVGGVFHVIVQSADSMEKGSRKDKTILRLFVIDDSDLVTVEIDKNPMNLQKEEIYNLTSSISNSTGLKVMLRDVKYHHLEGQIVYETSDVIMVLMNRQNSEIIPAEKVLAIMDRLKADGEPTVQITRAGTLSIVPSESISPIFYVCVIFFFSIILASVIFALMICNYRAKYNRECKLFMDDLVISNTLIRPHKRQLTLTNSDSSDNFPLPENYAIQERRISVGPDDFRRK